MDCPLESLPELVLHGLSESKPLPTPWPQFSIPRLAGRPQNPIINNLKRKNVTDTLPDIESDRSKLDSVGKEEKVNRRDIWLELKETASECKSHLVSWDTLRSSYRIPKSPSPFISEQTPDISTVARNPDRLLRSLHSNKEISISVPELYGLLRSTLVGCASRLYNWNVSEERFSAKDSSGGKTVLIVDGMDEAITDSYMSRFLEFGTLFRRLESVVVELRKSTRGDNPIAFAFAHCLSSILVWIRHEVDCALSGSQSTVCDIAISLEEITSILMALGSLCSRDLHLKPESYLPLPQIPQHLLSHLFDFLSWQTECQSPLLVRAVVSYILTVSSRPYFATISRSVGLVGLEDTLAASRRRPMKLHGDNILGDDEENEDSESEVELENDIKESFPTFVSDQMKESIIRARRSIRILSSPEFEGGRKIELPDFRELEWVWTDDEVSSRSLGCPLNMPKSDPAQSHLPKTEPQQVPGDLSQKYKPELANMAFFDLEPGSLRQDSYRTIVAFINSFPTFLPALTPTLTLLAEHVLAPVVPQANALGRAALRHFLTPRTSLHFRAHLVLLRAYLLLTAPSFKGRLAAALFSDASEDEDAEEYPAAVTSRARARNANLRAVQRRSSDPTTRVRYARPWPVGIAFGLTKESEWPPGGSDLSLHLRRVIMDSLEDVRETENMFSDALHKKELGDDEFWDEAESRLGFAIRDLPVGNGNDRWLDPTQIEALDFLYMQYKPPDPLRCLITTDILSKYQRIFAFLLRLLRVETAMRLVFRLMRPLSMELVFPARPDTQRLVLHFRFAAQAFMSAFSAYVADTAIRGNIDPFIARVRHAEVAAISESDSHVGPFPDVYALMQRHSRVLDAILSACLLRGAQQAVGDILRALLEVTLEFAVLVGNSYRSSCTPIQYNTFDEERAAQRVEALYAKFCKTRNALVKALQKIADRGSKPFAAESMTSSREKLPPASGGMEALVDLLLRIEDTYDGKK